MSFAHTFSFLILTVTRWGKNIYLISHNLIHSTTGLAYLSWWLSAQTLYSLSLFFLLFFFPLWFVCLVLYSLSLSMQAEQWIQTSTAWIRSAKILLIWQNYGLLISCVILTLLISACVMYLIAEAASLLNVTCDDATSIRHSLLIINLIELKGNSRGSSPNTAIL